LDLPRVIFVSCLPADSQLDNTILFYANLDVNHPIKLHNKIVVNTTNNPAMQYRYIIGWQNLTYKGNPYEPDAG
jgi:hypothetical protein